MDIYVGPENTHFPISRQLLRSHSVYFQHYLDRSNTPLYMDHDDPKAFELLTNWMQYGVLALHVFTEDVLNDADDYNVRGNGCHVLCELYCLCVTLQMETIHWEEIIARLGTLVRCRKGLPIQLRTIRTIFLKVARDSALTDYVLQEVADDLVDEEGFDYDHYGELLEGPQAVKGLVRELFRRMKRKKSSEPPRQGIPGFGIQIPTHE